MAQFLVLLTIPEPLCLGGNGLVLAHILRRSARYIHGRSEVTAGSAHDSAGSFEGRLSAFSRSCPHSKHSFCGRGRRAIESDRRAVADVVAATLRTGFHFLPKDELCPIGRITKGNRTRRCTQCALLILTAHIFCRLGSAWVSHTSIVPATQVADYFFSCLWIDFFIPP